MMCTMLDEIELKGIEKGRADTLISLVHDGLLDIGIAADRANMSAEEFETVMKESYPG